MPGPWQGARGPKCRDAQQMPRTAPYMHADWVVVEMVEVVVVVMEVVPMVEATVI